MRSRVTRKRHRAMSRASKNSLTPFTFKSSYPSEGLRRVRLFCSRETREMCYSKPPYSGCYFRNSILSSHPQFRQALATPPQIRTSICLSVSLSLSSSLYLSECPHVFLLSLLLQTPLILHRSICRGDRGYFLLPLRPHTSPPLAPSTYAVGQPLFKGNHACPGSRSWDVKNNDLASPGCDGHECAGARRRTVQGKE